MLTTEQVLRRVRDECGVERTAAWLSVRAIKGDLKRSKAVSADGRHAINLFAEKDVADFINRYKTTTLRNYA